MSSGHVPPRIARRASARPSASGRVAFQPVRLSGADPDRLSAGTTRRFASETRFGRAAHHTAGLNLPEVPLTCPATCQPIPAREVIGQSNSLKAAGASLLD